MFVRTHDGRWQFVAMSPDEGGGGGDGGGNGGGDAAGKTFTQADVDKIVTDRLGRERGKFADYDDLKSKASRLDEIEAAKKSDIEKANGERDTFKGRAESAESELAKYKAAGKAGLPIEHAHRISGTTPKEMEDDAKSLAAAFGGGGNGGGGGFDGGARGGGDQPQGMDALIRRAAGRT